jgi:hypothetical protein
MKSMIVAVAAVTSLLSQQGAAAFGTDGDGSVSGGKIEVHLKVSTPGIDAPLDLDAKTATDQIVWDTTDGTAGNGLNGLCAPEPIDDAHPTFGALFHVVGRDRQTNTIVYDQWKCVPFRDPSQPPPAPAPPPLPTIEEVWRAANLPVPTIHLDPPERGITGLATIIDIANAQPVHIRATIRGYAITGIATPSGYTIQIDGGTPTTTTRARHTFEYKGKHTITVGVIWHGVDTLTGADLTAAVTANIGDATITATRTYQVDEIRSVLQP